MAADDQSASAAITSQDADFRHSDPQHPETPVDFCDPPPWTAEAWPGDRYPETGLRDQLEKKHPAFQQAQGLWRIAWRTRGLRRTNSAAVVEFEAAMKRGDTKAANALMNKMMPWDRERGRVAARPSLTSDFTPMADQGDIKAQRRLAILYSWETN